MSRIVSLTRESLQMAIELVLNGKAPTDQLIPTAALLARGIAGCSL